MYFPEYDPKNLNRGITCSDPKLIQIREELDLLLHANYSKNSTYVKGAVKKLELYIKNCNDRRYKMQAYNLLGNIYMALGNPEKASVAYNNVYKLRESAPIFAEAPASRGKQYAHVQHSSETKKTQKTAKQTSSDNKAGRIDNQKNADTYPKEHSQFFPKNTEIAIIKVIYLQKRVREVLKIELKSVAKHFDVKGKSNNEKQGKILQKALGSTGPYKKFIENDFQRFGKKSTYFDVMSMDAIFSIFEICWDEIFKKYFNGEDYKKWRDKFTLCVKARDAVAHSHLDYLSESQWAKVNAYCTQILDVLEKTCPERRPA